MTTLEIIVVVLFIGIVTYFSRKIKSDKIPYFPTDSIMTEEEKDLLDMINSYRVNNKLNPLKTDSFTHLLSEEHTVSMINSDVLSHDGFTDRCDELTKRGSISSGECVGHGYSSMYGFMNGYILSPPHKKELDNPNFTHIGISVMPCDNDKLYNTLLFTQFK